MKKIVYALVLAILLPLFSANAEKLSVPAQMNNNTFKNFKVTKEMLLTPRMDIMSEKYSNKLQADEYFTKIIGGTGAGWFIGYDAQTSPMAYEPVSNTLIYTTTNWYSIAGVMNSTVNIYWTSDMGENWGKDTLGEFKDNIIVMSPSVVISNTNNATAFKDLSIVTFSKYLTYDNIENPWTGAYYQIRLGADYQPWQTFGPEEGENSDFYLWGDVDMAIYKVNNEVNITSVSQLNPNPAEEYAQYGTYGQASINIDSYNNIFSIPNEWSGSNFKPGPDFTHTYNGRMMVDADNSGNVYSCVFNFNINNDYDGTRTPAVSKSTDGGNTWSSLNLCPTKLVEDYMAANNFLYRFTKDSEIPDWYKNRAQVGSLTYWSSGEYAKNAFVASGNDEYSFITPMLCWFVEDGVTNIKTRIVEFKYKSDTWSINNIADLDNVDSPFDAHQVNQGQVKMYDTLKLNLDGFELLAAKTADGNDIICTWVANTKMLKFVPPVVTTLNRYDSLYTTDIFGAVRPITGSSWTTAQFTNDDHYNKMTRMPKLVPNRNSIPMIAHDSRFSTDDTDWLAYPAQFRNMNYRTYQASYIMNFDFSNPEKYYPNISVENQPVINFTLNAPVPNPSNGLTELTFNMNEGAFTTIAVFNAMGVKVAELQNGYTSEGVHGLNVNTESYVSGVYYIVLTAGSNSATTLLNVVR